ncbi:MAG TPA: succinate dehydrogenase/fumarate reductase iron-sulfur subunit [Cyanobacteria bacterium UBA8803]|nr:succinate dehydrogenase/fumarate reductase iron-sulfur subunit [Cyanobacteria bacterium UBA9273]HBL60796.1 succinate dehydrogenase/fumarate reductase iron-sulfur subunit [Cyanobacteria bacterium UBA8803]
MQVAFKIIRQTQNTPPRVQTYTLDVEEGNTILDCLNRIKWEQDGSLAFRKNCRNTICGSCAMRINGRSALACKENVGSELAKLPPTFQSVTPEITVAPLGNLPVIKDLVVDMRSFWDNLEAVDPYVSTSSRAIPEREFLQTPEERSRLDQNGNCIMCGACYSECNAREVNPDFVGPHALAKAQRLVADSRDTATESRIEEYNKGTQGVWGCTRCYMCNAVCPMEVAPLDQIGKIKQEILARKDDQASRSIRHRKILINLVKKGGWVDERQFGLQVVANSFRDIKGLLSLGPLGLRMIARGKFPLGFDASEGTAQVRSLIESVQNLKSNKE